MSPVMGEVIDRARNAFSIQRLPSGTFPAFSGIDGQISHLAGELTASGVKVSEQGALRVAAVWIATTLLADEVSSMSWRMLQREDTKRLPQRDPRLPAVWGRPNSDQTLMGIKATETLSLTLGGAVYEMLGWTRAGVLDVRWPLDPAEVRLDRPEPGVLRLQVPGAGELVNRPGDRPQFMFIPRYTLPGKLEPVSPVRAAAELIGRASTYDRMAAKMAGRGFNPSAVISVAATLDNDMAQEYAGRIERIHGGADATGKVAVFSGKDTKVEPWSMKLVDAQFIAQVDQVFSVLMAMWRVPPTVAGMVDKPSTWGSGVAEFARGLERFTLRPIVELLQDGYEAYMLHPVADTLQWRGIFDSMLSASPTERANVQRLRLMYGMTSQERVLAQEDEAPFEDDETVYTQLSMSTESERRLEQIRKAAQAAAELVRAGVEQEQAFRAVGLNADGTLADG
jgi:HK97 family phage portal protein